MRPRARLQKGPYHIVKVWVGIQAVRIKIMGKKTKDKRERVQKYLPHAHIKLYTQRNSFGSKMEAFPCFDVIARYEYRSPISEFKIVQSEDFLTRS